MSYHRLLALVQLFYIHRTQHDNEILHTPQPIQSGYRNKCEFTVGVSATEMKPVVGFRLGSYEEGDLTVVSAQSCVHVPQKMKEIAMVTYPVLHTLVQ